MFPLHCWSLYSWDPITAPRCRWPSVVILTSSPNTNSASSAISCVFTTRALLSANVRSHWLGSHISFLLGQKAYTSSDQFYNRLIGPPPAESPASHTCLTSGIRVLRLWIKMDMFIAYHGIARGSPCVVPSWDKISSPPPVNNLEGRLYMLMIYMAISGQEIWMLLASTNRIPSVPSTSEIWAMACMVASIPALWLAQTCRAPAASLISSFNALFTRREGNPGARFTLPIGLP